MQEPLKKEHSLSQVPLKTLIRIPSPKQYKYFLENKFPVPTFTKLCCSLACENASCFNVSLGHFDCVLIKQEIARESSQTDLDKDNQVQPVTTEKID